MAVPSFTTDQWLVIGLIFLLGIVIGMFLASGSKWKNRYREEVRRCEALEVENKRLRDEAVRREAALPREEVVRRETVVRTEPLPPADRIPPDPDPAI